MRLIEADEPDRTITKRCDTCKHHKPASWYGEGWCENPKSPYYDYYTFNTAYCKEWEGEDAPEMATNGE